VSHEVLIRGNGKAHDDERERTDEQEGDGECETAARGTGKRETIESGVEPGYPFSDDPVKTHADPSQKRSACEFPDVRQFII
jgi:hypothetical protein